MIDSAESVAEDVLSRHAAARIPVDIHELAESMGITEIVERRGHGDGRLETVGTRTRIVIRPRTAPRRRRFTVAHELGHLYLRTQHPMVSMDTLTEERFCNRFAAAVLMPRRWVQTRGGREDLVTLRAIAEDADVSLSAALLRLRQLCEWRNSLLRWRYDGTVWSLSAATGLPAGTPLPSNAPATIALLERTCEPDEIVRSMLPIALDGHYVELDAHLWVSRMGAVALVDLRSAWRRLPSQSDRATAMWRELARLVDSDPAPKSGCAARRPRCQGTAHEHRTR
jgi:IrrE N-terminal-like domain